MPPPRSSAPFPQWGQQPPHWEGSGLPPAGWAERTSPLRPVPPPPPAHYQRGQFPPPGQYGPPLPYYPPRPRRRKWPWLVAGGTLALVGGVVGIGAAAGWFTTYVLDGPAVELGVRRILGDDYELSVSDVSCPDEQPMTPGHSFTCTVYLGGENGPRQIRVTVETEQGRYRVDRPTG